MKRLLQLFIVLLLMMNLIFQNQVYFVLSYIASFIISYHFDLTNINKTILYGYRRQKLWQLLLSSVFIILVAYFYNNYHWTTLALSSCLYFIVVIIWSHVRITHDGITYRLSFYSWESIEELPISKNYRGEYEIQLSTFRRVYLDKKGLDFVKM